MLITICVLAGLVALETGLFLLLIYYLLKSHTAHEASWKTERRELLDRIMSVDYEKLWISRQYKRPQEQEKEETEEVAEDDLLEDVTEAAKELLEETE